MAFETLVTTPLSRFGLMNAQFLINAKKTSKTTSKSLPKARIMGTEKTAKAAKAVAIWIVLRRSDLAITHGPEELKMKKPREIFQQRA